jgi:type I restriction enzyme S subunit
LERRPVKVIADHQYQEIGIYSYGRGIFHKRPRTGLEVGDKDLFLMKEGDLILQITFAWEGAIALCSKADDGLYGSVRYPTFRVNEDRCLAPFLVKYLRTREGLEQIGRICPGSAGRNRVLSIKRLSEIMVPLPEVSEQIRIVKRIEELASKVEEAIELNKVSSLAGGRLLSAMAHRSDLTTEAKLAQGWQRAKLRDVLTEYSDPIAVRTDVSYPNFGIYSFGRGLFTKVPISGLQTSASRLFRARAGLFIYSRLFAFEGAYGLVEGKYNGYLVSNEYPMFSCKEDRILPEFLVSYLLPSNVWRDIAEGSGGLGDRRQRVQPHHFLKHEILLPPIDWQHEMKKVRTRFLEAATLKAEVASELNAMLPAILDQAFKGNL